MASQWAEHEKRSLLTEVIKASHVPLESLVAFIKEVQILPDWNEVVTPNGRNVSTSAAIYQQLMSNSSSFHSTAQSRSQQASHSSRKRPHSPEPPRALQPRPTANGAPIPARSSSMGAPPRKRGRPSNAEIAARQADAKAHGDVHIAPKGPTSKTEGAVSLANILGPNIDQPVNKTPSSKQNPQGESSARKRGRPRKIPKDNDPVTAAINSPSPELRTPIVPTQAGTTRAPEGKSFESVVSKGSLQDHLA